MEQQPLEPVGVAQHQRQPLVRRHAPREADRQDVGVERRRRPSRARPAATPRCRHDLRSRRAGVDDEPLAQQPLDGPDVCRTTPGRPRSRRSRRRRPRRPRRGGWRGRRPREPTQVGACTPLVIEVIGTSASSKAGHRPWNISRLTWPCSWETPLARWARRKPITAMLNTAGSPPVVVLGAEREDPVDRYAGERAGRAEVLLDRASRGKRSMPAGTGVWVVKTVRGARRPRARCRSRAAGRSPRRSARGSARDRGSRRGPRWCGTPRAPRAPVIRA